ncbi:hypothetical protein B9Z39_03340 [Limnohabitans sp. JirII-29]|uniref:hypothetical protein n=1 Tax=Limnohabitans sp. JirII-29 TaxID=1835756 RepID=UPI000D364FBB|nr:hypothetical protein [Limnohabitans sp. JirII-29]PUE29121.1 hypothetical protein B9Z39_03340 [Limnohabitans sp. JirII-29]
MDSRFTILVNSSDGFTDCWGPFFKLLQRYWPGCQSRILLNTETHDYQHPELPVVATKVQGDSPRRLTWSECLSAALDQVQTPLILYFQEDYFIRRAVQAGKVEAALEHMLAHPEVKHIALTGIGSQPPFEPYVDTRFQKIRRRARYRISTQAALWRVETLKSYLVAEENGWMFEIYGTWRARKRDELFLCADYSDASGGPAIEYLHTGIVKGQWLQEIQDDFEANDIDIDFGKRGFYQPKNVLRRKIETGMRLLERPGYLLKQLM